MAQAVDDFLNALKQRRPQYDVDAELLDSALGQLSQEWLSCQGYGPSNVYEWCCAQFNIDPNQITPPKEMRYAYWQTTLMLMDLFKLMKETTHPDDGVQFAADGMVCESHEKGLARREQFSRIMNLVQFAGKHVVMSGAISCYIDDDSYKQLNFDEKALQLIDDSDLKPMQYIIRAMLTLLSQMQRRARKFEDGVYYEICVEHQDGNTVKTYRTFAWKREVTIKKFIYDNISSTMDYMLWKKLTDSADNATKVATYLEESSEPEFPELQFNPKYFSFRNGLLDIDALAFFPFKDEESWPDIVRSAQERMRQHEPEFTCTLPDHHDVSMKFFDCDFDESLANFENVLECDASNIACEALVKIMSDQLLEEETIFWFFVFLGRLMFNVGEKDNWQVLLYLKGVAGSGKSTMSNLMKYLYTADRVGVLSSNAEEKFGLAPLYDKKLVICPEAKKNFSISQGDLQSMVSGEDVSVAIKHKTAKTVEWKASLMFCGNEIPNWQDASGSMTRRLLMFMFNKKIKNADTELTKKLHADVGQFIFRAVLSYRQAVIKYGSCGIWDKKEDGSPILSAQIHSFAKDVAKSVQPLTKYLQESGQVLLGINNSELEYDDEMCMMPESIFITNFRQWCKDMGLDTPTWNEDSYGTIFESYNIERRQEEHMWENEMIKGWFLFGVRMALTN